MNDSEEGKRNNEMLSLNRLMTKKEVEEMFKELSREFTDKLAITQSYKKIWNDIKNKHGAELESTLDKYRKARGGKGK